MSAEIVVRRLGFMRYEATRRLTPHAWRVEYRRTRRGARKAVQP